MPDPIAAILFSTGGVIKVCGLKVTGFSYGTGG